jgi:hypothetical protein
VRVNANRGTQGLRSCTINNFIGYSNQCIDIANVMAVVLTQKFGGPSKGSGVLANHDSR